MYEERLQRFVSTVSARMEEARLAHDFIIVSTSSETLSETPSEDGDGGKPGKDSEEGEEGSGGSGVGGGGHGLGRGMGHGLGRGWAFNVGYAEAVKLSKDTQLYDYVCWFTIPTNIPTNIPTHIPTHGDAHSNTHGNAHGNARGNARGGRGDLEDVDDIGWIVPADAEAASATLSCPPPRVVKQVVTRASSHSCGGRGRNRFGNNGSANGANGGGVGSTGEEGKEGEERVAVQCMRLNDVRLVNGWTHETLKESTTGTTGGVAEKTRVAGVEEEEEEERWGEADVDMDMTSRLKKGRMRLVQRDEGTSGYRCLDNRIGIAGDITGGDIRSVDPRHLFQSQQQQQQQKKGKKGEKGERGKKRGQRGTREAREAGGGGGSSLRRKHGRGSGRESGVSTLSYVVTGRRDGTIGNAGARISHVQVAPLPGHTQGVGEGARGVGA